MTRKHTLCLCASTLAMLIFTSAYLTPYPIGAGASSQIDTALGKGITYFENVQSQHGLQGEFATYRWGLPNQNDKEYNFTVFSTPFVLHTLNRLALTYWFLPEVQSSAFNSMRSKAKTHLISNMEPLLSHNGVWRFFGLGSGLPPDFCSTSCNLECTLSFDPSLWGTQISTNLTDFFLGYRRPIDGAFNTWLTGTLTDVCACTNANTLFFYASRGDENKIQTTMNWLNQQLDYMIANNPLCPYAKSYYRSPYAFTYLATRAYNDGGAPTFLDNSKREILRNYIFNSQESDGSWPTYSEFVGPQDELETALALCSLMNLGWNEFDSTELNKVGLGITYLLNRQNQTDGSWPCCCFYLGAPPKADYGSPEMTTAVCMEALAKYAEPHGVGGLAVPVDKLALLTPYIGLASTTAIGAVATVAYVKRAKRREEKQ